MNEHKYSLVEIFHSIQGEGLLSGTPTTFVRFTGCNLRCSFCDTNFNSKNMVLTEDELVETIRKTVKNPNERITFTGGEPMLQLTRILCDRLMLLGHPLALESNGTIYDAEKHKWMLSQFRHVCISPKKEGLSPDLVQAHLCNEIRIDELRFVVPPEGVPFSTGKRIPGTYIVLSPQFDDMTPTQGWKVGDGHTVPKMNPSAIQRALALVDVIAHDYPVRLSLQTHKILGVR